MCIVVRILKDTTSTPLARSRKPEHSGFHKGALDLAVQSGRVELVLIKNEHLTIEAKREVGNAVFDKNLPKQHTAGRPHIDTITTTRIDISRCVNFDPVGNANTRHSKEAAIGQKRLTMQTGHIKGITNQS